MDLIRIIRKQRLATNHGSPDNDDTGVAAQRRAVQIRTC